MNKNWFKRRMIAILLLFPAYALAWVMAQSVPRLFPWLPWDLISPYTIGAITSTVFNTLMWDRWTRLIYRFGGT